MRYAIALSLLAISFAPQPPHTWAGQASGVTTRLRGVSAVSRSVVWASGAEGTVVRSVDGGRNWQRLTVPDAGKLDFRDVDAVDERTAFVLSIGPGSASRIYRTVDGGGTWTLQFRNEDPKAFFDALAFADPRRGFAFSDSVDGRFVVLRTDDGGEHWVRVPEGSLPAARAGEGAYAASGSNIAVREDRVWIGTTASRVLRSEDRGHTWEVFETPLATGESAGIFSIAFADDTHGIVVGGDYRKDTEAADNVAVTSDSGRTWTLTRGVGGFRSAVAYVPGRGRMVVAVGPTGADLSEDGGRTWRRLIDRGFHAMSFAPGTRTAWVVGEGGAIARLEIQ